MIYPAILPIAGLVFVAAVLVNVARYEWSRRNPGSATSIAFRKRKSA